LNPALETKDLYKRFGALTVADRINFRLEAGARHALIGPNGSGKTTFVNMLTGRIAPTRGDPVGRRGHRRSGRRPG
jgi:ABC-type branched-subunit amino acid transport system ATPase component